MNNNQLAKSWSSKNAVEYYLNHRDTIKGLYNSERYFIKSFLKNGNTILDIGCATGGFSKIVRQYNKKIEYAGVDISPRMIDLAKKRFPKINFRLCSKERLDFPDNSFDMCICFGVLHMTESWKELLAEAWRVCNNAILFDMRLLGIGGVCDARISYQRLEFDAEWDGASKAPYVIVALKEAMDYIMDLKPAARSLGSYGYWAPVSKMTVSKYRDVCMSVFFLGKKKRVTAFEWQLPLEYPGRLKRGRFI